MVFSHCHGVFFIVLPLTSPSKFKSHYIKLASCIPYDSPIKQADVNIPTVERNTQDI